MPQTFVGRKKEMNIYQEFLYMDSPWVLVISGIGGVGKTTLLRQFEEHTPSDTAVVKLDFTEEALRTNTSSILSAIAQQMEPYCSEETVSTFKSIFQEQHAALITLHSQLEHVQASVKMRESISTVVSEKAEREIHLQVRERITDALYEQIKTSSATRLMLMLDTYELLNDGWVPEAAQWLINEYLPDLHKRLLRKRRHCSVVIASRVVPHFETFREKEVRYIALSMLSEEGVRDYLIAQGMNEVTWQKRVYEITHGHALSLSIMTTLWREHGEQTLTASPLIEEEFNEKASIEFIQERLYRYLETPYKELTRYSALLRSFDLPLLRAVFPEFLLEPRAYEVFERFIRYSYIAYVGNYRYVMHDLLRSIQSDSIWEHERDRWIFYYKLAYDYFKANDPGSPDYYYYALAATTIPAEVDTIQHALVAGNIQNQAMAEWLDAIQKAQMINMRERVDALLQVVDDRTLKLTPLSQARRALQKGNFYFYYRDKRLNEALDCYEEALQLYQAEHNIQGEADALQLMGRLEQFRKDMHAALEHYEHALKLYKSVNDVLSEANAYKSIGDVQLFHDDVDKARSSYEKALRRYRDANDPLGRANVHKALGDMHQLAKPEQALWHYEHALALYKEIDDRLGQANALQAMGEIKQYNNEVRFDDDLDASLVYYKQAQQLYREVQQRLGEANVSKAIGDVHFLRKNASLALASYQHALALYREVEDCLGEANATKAIGDVLQFRDELENAQLYYELALILYHQVNYRLGEADVLQAMGKISQGYDKLTQAMQQYRQALDLYQQTGNLMGEADVQLTLGDVLQTGGDLHAATKCYDDALSLYQKIGSKLGEANCFMAQGRVLAEQAKYSDALALYNKAYELYKNLQDIYSQARLLFYRSYIYSWQDDNRHALQDAEQALEIAQRLELPFVNLFKEHFDFLRLSTL